MALRSKPNANEQHIGVDYPELPVLFDKDKQQLLEEWYFDLRTHLNNQMTSLSNRINKSVNNNP